MGIFVAVIDPLVMNKNVNLPIRKGKTDTLDAVKIANFGLDHWYHLVDYSPTVDVYDELKTLNPPIFKLLAYEYPSEARLLICWIE